MYKVPRNTSSSTSSTAVKIPGLRVTYDHSEITVYPNPEIYVLHSSQGQFSGIHDLIEFLKLSRLLHVFRFSGNIRFHTIGPKLLKENVSKGLKCIEMYQKERGSVDNVETSIFSNDIISFPRTSSVNTTKINKIFKVSINKQKRKWTTRKTIKTKSSILYFGIHLWC